MISLFSRFHVRTDTEEPFPYPFHLIGPKLEPDESWAARCGGNPVNKHEFGFQSLLN